MSSMLFLSPASMLMIVALNSGLGILLISVMIRTLAMAFSCSLFWDEFFYVGILSRYLSSSLLEKPVIFLAPESNGFIKKMSYNVQDVELKGMSLVCSCALCCCILVVLSPRSVI